MDSVGAGALSNREAARFLGCSERTVHRLKQEGRLPHFRIGRIVRYRVDALREYMIAAEAETQGGEQ